MSPRLRLVARWGGRRSARSRFVALSATGHVLLVAAMILLPGLRARPRIAEDVIPVVLAAPGPTTPPARVESPAPVEPEPSAPPEGVRVETREPEPKPLPEKKKPEEPPPEPPKPRPQPPRPADSEPASAPPAQTGPLPGEAAGGVEGNAEISSLDLDDLEFAWYRDRLIVALKSNWRQPVLDGIEESLAVTVSFTILRDGSVRAPRIDTSSGIPSLDRSALRAVIESDPLPQLPPNWRQPTMSARFVFRWYPGD